MQESCSTRGRADRGAARRREPMLETSALNSIDFPPTPVDEVVIIGHGLPERLVCHELLLDGEEIIDLLDLHLSDDGLGSRKLRFRGFPDVSTS